MDLSLLGCRLRLGERLQRGQKIRVILECVKSTENLQVDTPGEVVWSRLEGLSYQVGIHFLKEASGLDALLNALR
jgi:hypothetical protein